jgi:hypothetical protein
LKTTPGSSVRLIPAGTVTCGVMTNAPCMQAACPMVMLDVSVPTSMST